MQKRKNAARIAGRVYVGLGVAGLVAGGVRADVITPTSDFASSYYSSAQNPVNLINNSGMNETGPVSSWTAQSDGSANGMWHAGAGQGIGGSAPVVANQYVVFDLGANYTLTSAYLWQMFQPGNLGRGIQNFQLLASPNAPSAADAANPPATYNTSGFTTILNTSILNEASSSSPTQTFSLSGATNVRQVYLKILSDWNGFTNDYVGLSEIKFEGTPFASPNFIWNNAAGGSWQTGGNWTPAGPPTASDGATFSLANSYTVGLTTDAAVGPLNVSAGNVTLNLGSNLLQADTINLNGGSLAAPSLVFGAASAGQAGFTTALNFNDGTLEIQGGIFKPQVGPVTVSGTYTNSFAISGQAGTLADPTLKLTGGASVSTTGSSNFDGSVLIGINGGQGTAIVTGSGSSLNTPSSTGLIVVGEGGAVVNSTYSASNGSLQLSNNAQAQSHYDIFIGKDGGAATASVDSGATLTSTASNLHVGDGKYATGTQAPANGTLTISGGGQAAGLSVVIGMNGGTGKVTVTGTGSSLKDTATNGNLFVGYNGGNGTLDIADHAQVSSVYPISIGFDLGTGKVTVDGGASLSSAQYLYVGGSDSTLTSIPGNGTLALTNGGTATATKSIGVGSAGVGVATVDGLNSILSGKGVDIGVSDGGNGTLAVTNQGQVVSSGDMHIGDTGGVGQATVDGTGSTISAATGIYVGDTTSSNTSNPGVGTLTVTNGGSATSPSAVFVGTLGGSGTLNIGKSDGTDAGGTSVNTYDLQLAQYGTNNSNLRSIVNIYNGGTANVSDVLTAYTNSAAPANTRVNLAGGTIKTAAVNLQDASLLNWTSGTLWLTGGSSTTNGALTVPAAGTLKGSGSISGAVTSAGLISPGDNSTATLSFNNGLTIGTLENQGRFAADIDFGHSTSDLLNVSGTVSLINAELDLSLISPPAELASPVTFVLINNDGIDPVIGTFASVVPSTFSNFQYSINYAYNNGGMGLGNDVAITFSAVPEPGSAMLILMGSLGALIRRRRSSGG